MASDRHAFFQLELLDNRYPVLHGLRVVAILSVIQYHLTWILHNEAGVTLDREFVRTSLSLFFGMDLFFILSGFLIGSILLHSLKTTGRQNVQRFYLRRVLRTFPSYYVVLFGLVGLFGLNAEQRSHLVYEVFYLTNFVTLQRNDVVMSWGWSLAFEEQFYLSVPLLFFLLSKLRTDQQRLGLLAILWCVPLVIRLFLFFRQDWTELDLYRRLYFRTDTRFDTIVVGIMLAVLHQRFGEHVDRFFASKNRSFIVLVFSAACLWFLLQPSLFGARWVQLMHVFAWGTITSLMYFGFLLFMLRSKGPGATLLSHPFFRRIATLGYGVYLVHLPLVDHVAAPIAKLLAARGFSHVMLWFLSMGIVCALSLLLATVLHLLVEKPSLWLRDKCAL
jgi:peptidoglycan/LPS O-acetylase OafA/YrhL